MQQPRTSSIRVGIMGAGAVGCYVGGQLTRAPTVEVVLVGRPRLGAEIAAAGLTLTDLGGDELVVPARELAFETDPGALSSCDVVLCCVKSGHTDDVARTLAEVLAPGAIVVSLQNGVRNAGMLRAHLADHQVLAGIVAFNVVGRGGGGFHQTTKGGLMVEASDDPRLRILLDALSACGFEVAAPRDIVPHQWSKLLVNLNNAVSALSGAPTRDMILSPGYRRVIALVMGEGLRVLRAANIRPAALRGIPIALLPTLLRLPTPLVRLVSRAQLRADPDARSSMWQDLAHGRNTEVDFLNGEIVRLAEELGIDAPVNRRIVELVHEVEANGTGSPNMSAEALAALGA